MPKVITIYLTDEEAKEIERFCEEKGMARYTAIKMAIREFCAHSVSNPHASPKSNNPSSFKEHARYACAGCGVLLAVEGLKSCPVCGHTKYKEV